jgi:hypothetical protein
MRPPIRTSYVRNASEILAAVIGLATACALAGCAAEPRAAATPVSATGGPGFPPAVGWTTRQTTDARLPQAAAAVTTTGVLADLPGSAPHRTLARLRADEVLIQTMLYGRVGFRPPLDRGYPPRTLPLRVGQGTAQHDWEGGHGLRSDITGRVDGWLVETIVYFGTPKPGAATRRLADEQLARLVLPDPCPVHSEPLNAAQLGGAEDAVAAILFTGDGQKPSFSVRRATPDDPIPEDCTDVPRDRIARVDVRFPERRSETCLVSLQNGRAVVWARVR